MTQEDECAGDDLAGVLDGPRINLWMTLLEIFDEMRPGISQHIYRCPRLRSMCCWLNQNSICG